MSTKETPLIKGMFIKSHIERLRTSKGEMGEAAVEELERRYGKPLHFKNFTDYPVRDEIEIIEHVLDLLHDKPILPADRTFEAGRLHLRNFRTTPYGKIVMAALPKTSDGFKRLLLSAQFIARHVFKNTHFKGEELEPRALKVTMENNDYPIDHFRGLFFEWMYFWGLENPQVTAKETAPQCYEYMLKWDNSI